MPLPESLAALRIEAPSHPRLLFAGRQVSDIAFLRADDEATMLAAFASAGVVPDGDGAFPTQWPGVGDIAVLGTIYNNDGEYDPETGDVITPPTAKSGWHVNVLPVG